MRKVVINNIVSLDGFYADSTGNPLALEMDAAFDRANLDSIQAADTVLLGRESFDMFSGYWPFIAGAPEPEDRMAPEARAVSETNRAMSRRYNTLPKMVVSSRGPIPEDNAWADSTTVVSREDLDTWVRDGDPDTIVVVFGSRRLWNDLLADRLVHELHLMVSPNTLAAGIPLFTQPADLTLRDVRRFPGSSNIQLRYAVR